MKTTRITYAIGLAAGLTLLSACGDDVTNVTTKIEIESVAAFEKLSKCENDNVGSLAFVADSAKTYTCTEDGWVSTAGIDGRDGEDGMDGDDGSDGADGKKGKKGARGADGKDGTACIAKELSSGEGYKIVCDGDSVGVVKNGKNGPEGEKGEKGDDGEPGDTGEGCEMSPEPNGNILVTCGNSSATIYSAVPGGTIDSPVVTPPIIIPPTPTVDSTCWGPTMWCKSETISRVETGVDVGRDDSGYWFAYGDNADGGRSKIEWPVQLGNEYDPLAIDPVVEHCQGLCGTVTLDKGTLNKAPFAGVAFYIGGTEDGYTPARIDISPWVGICITYTSDLPARLLIGQGDEQDAALNYDLPFVRLPRSTSPVEQCFTWTDFVQEGGAGGQSTNGATASIAAASLKIEFSTKDGDSGEFNIIRLRKYGEGHSTTPNFEGTCNAMWCGDTDVSGRVNTGFDTESSGQWFSYTDVSVGGSSSIVFPTYFFVPLIMSYNGIRGHVSIGNKIENPYAGVGFEVVSLDDIGGDITDWGGICLAYQSTIGFHVELATEEDPLSTNFSNYMAPVAESEDYNVVNLSWDDFEQRADVETILDKDEVLTKVSDISFVFGGTSETEGEFTIYKVGKPGTCQP